jgi:hypothetical protein
MRTLLALGFAASGELQGIQFRNREITMRKTLISLCFVAPFALGAAELAGTWKYTAPPNPDAKGNRPPAETVYAIKVDGNRFTGTMLVNRDIADILNGAIDGDRITFERLDGSGRKTAFKGEIGGDAGRGIGGITRRA